MYFYHVFAVLYGALLLYVCTGRLPAGKLASRYHWYFHVQLLWFSASVAWAADRRLALLYVGYVLVGAFTAISIVRFLRSEERLDAITRTLRVVFGLDLAFGLLEAFTRFRLPVSRFSP